MDNIVLEDIKNYAIKRLKQSYGYCGLAESPTSVMLNSDDKNGIDIIITLKSKPS